MLRRMKLLGANNADLVDCYIKQARSVLEYCAVVWHAGLSQTNNADIKKVQKSACAMILGKNYAGYQAALASLGLEKLETRRKLLSIKFDKKSFKSKIYYSWFVPDTNPLNTRREAKRVKEAKCRTKRLHKSALPYLTHVLNADPKK